MNNKKIMRSLKNCHCFPIILTFFLALSVTLLLTYKSEAAAQFAFSGSGDAAFSVPVFPGTKLVETFDSAITVCPPFTALTFILQTESGGELDAAKVIEFYKEVFLKKGWKQDEALNQASQESSLIMQSRFHNSDTGRNITGQFCLYVAAKDGLITLYLSQWRNSYAGQSTTDLFGSLIKQLNEVEKEGYLKYYSNGELQRWEYFFEDENFIEGMFYNWITEDTPRSIIEAIIAVYTDEQSAQKAKNNLLFNDVLIECRNNILVMIKSYPEKPSKAVREAEQSVFNVILSAIPK